VACLPCDCGLRSRTPVPNGESRYKRDVKKIDNNLHEEGIKESITPGRLAEFVVLSDDRFTVDKEKINDLQIVRTVVGGTTVYQV